MFGLDQWLTCRGPRLLVCRSQKLYMNRRAGNLPHEIMCNAWLTIPILYRVPLYIVHDNLQCIRFLKELILSTLLCKEWIIYLIKCWLFNTWNGRCLYFTNKSFYLDFFELKTYVCQNARLKFYGILKIFQYFITVAKKDFKSHT